MKIRLENISKEYTLKTVLSNVSCNFDEKKIHAIIGENGAGKSTLVEILSGERCATSGNIFLDECLVHFTKPKDAIEKGICLVKQNPPVAKDLTVKENIFLNVKRTKQNEKNIVTLIKTWAKDLSLTSLIKNLSTSQKFYTALISCLASNPSVLVLDEPTSMLNEKERLALYENLKDFVKNGNTVIIITHNISEVSNFADTVTILSNGKIISHYEKKEDFLKELKTYEKINKNEKNVSVENTKRKNIGLGKNCFEVINLTSCPKDRPALFNVSFKATSSEIVLIRGAKDSALYTLEDVITGMASFRSKGKIIVNEKEIDLSRKELKVSFLREEKVCIVPSDKIYRGSNPNISVEEMLTNYYIGNWPDAFAEYLIEESNVSITHEELTSNLSGGMMQKLILTRELNMSPEILILSEPLQGLDFEKSEILCEKLKSLSMEGKTIIVLSTDIFPETFCTSSYFLEGGTLRKIF